MPSRFKRRASEDAASRSRQGAHVAEMQRRRLLSAAIHLVANEGGAQEVTVFNLCQRARVSRRTFYELFEDREGCLVATFEEALAQTRNAIMEERSADESWRVGMRGALTALLGVWDERPELARLLIVEALSAGPVVLERRAHVIHGLIAAVDEGRAECEPGKTPPPLTAEGVVGAVFAVVHARLLEPMSEGRSLLGLTSQLMSLVVHPYLGASAAQAELDTSTPEMRAGRERQLLPEPFKDLTMRLTYRTVLVLSSIAATPGSSNKQVASIAGVSDQGQMSRLLGRLERNGLVHNAGGEPSKGEAKAWMLTPRGEILLQAAGQT